MYNLLEGEGGVLEAFSANRNMQVRGTGILKTGSWQDSKLESLPWQPWEQGSRGVHSVHSPGLVHLWPRRVRSQGS